MQQNLRLTRQVQSSFIECTRWFDVVTLSLINEITQKQAVNNQFKQVDGSQ